MDKHPFAFVGLPLKVARRRGVLGMGTEHSKNTNEISALVGLPPKSSKPCFAFVGLPPKAARRRCVLRTGTKLSKHQRLEL